jgi:hypothetical protein
MSSGFDRRRIKFAPLSERKNKVLIERDRIPIETRPGAMSETGRQALDETIERLKLARDRGTARMLTIGAHTIKNGLAPVLIELMEKGWITHLATNGAGIIHDWEFAFQGESSEDVRENVDRGRFGIWDETGFYLNLALLVGAYEGLGYGGSIGKFVEEEGLDIPAEKDLVETITECAETEPEKAAAAADLLARVKQFELQAGRMDVPHPFKRFGVQAAAWRLGIPFTGHPMIGHDIIYCHPMNSCAAIGRAAERDFLSFADSVSHLDGGVYLSVGSAVMSPMIFEKSLSMAQNIAIQQGKHINDHYMVVVDLQQSQWDWSKGEPPQDNPDYYLRYCKSFARMGGTMKYISADNRDFLLTLIQQLET